MEHSSTADLTNHTTDDHNDDFDSSYTTRFILREIIILLIALIGTSCTVLIIYILTKYKNLRKPVNIYIMNWLICNALTLFAEPAAYRLIWHLDIDGRVICSLVSLILVIQTVSILFMLALMFQWFLERRNTDFFEKHCLKIVFACWGVGFVEAVYVLSSCHVVHFWQMGTEIFIFILILVYIVCIIVMGCLRKCANPFTDTTSVPVALLSGYVVCWCVPLFFVILQGFFRGSNFVHTLQQFAYTVVDLYPLVIFYLFYKIDRQFSICCKVLFGCSSSGDINTVCAEFENDEEFEVESGNRPTQVFLQ